MQQGLGTCTITGKLELPSVRLKDNAPPPFPLPQDSAQQTMLLLWLIELHLNDLKSEVKEKTRRELQAEFRQFLASPFLKVRGRGGREEGCGSSPIPPPQDRLEENQKTIYDLLSSHGAVEDVVHFANLMKGQSSPLMCVCIHVLTIIIRL